MARFQLTVPKPCTEDWNSMTATQKGVFCASCQKEVVDFTKMSDREVREYFNRAKGKICGKLSDNQLNKVYAQPLITYRWWKWILAGITVLGLPLALPNISAHGMEERSDRRQPLASNTISSNSNILLRVVDNQSKPISYARVRVLSEETTISTDYKGEARLNVTQNIMIILYAEGYQSKRLEIQATSKDDSLTITLEKEKIRLASSVLEDSVCTKQNIPDDLMQPLHGKLGGVIAIPVEVDESFNWLINRIFK